MPNRGESKKDISAGVGGVYNSLTLSLHAYGHMNPVKYIDPDGRDVAILLDRQAAGDQGHSAIAVFENGGKGKVTYLSYGPVSSGKPMKREFKNKAGFFKFLKESTYGDNPKKGSGFNYDEVAVLKTNKTVDKAVIKAGSDEVGKKRWSLLGNLFGNEFDDPDVNCKDMSRNSLGAAGISLDNRMKPNNWQDEVVNKTKKPRNSGLETQIQGVLDKRNNALKSSP